MSLATTITPAIIDKMIGLLVPLFLIDTPDDPLAARHAASCVLADYDVETKEELRLAAQIISFSFGALDARSRSMAPDLTLNAWLRLQGSASTQFHAANQCQRTLDKLRRARQQADLNTEVEPDLIPPLTLETLRLTDYKPPALSHQQRRANERQTEKAQRSQAERARREAMHTARTGSPQPAAA